jgi:predicted RNA-binding protein with PUA domain
MEIPDKLREVLKYEGVVSIVTQGEGKPHIANSWNSYLMITGDGNLLIPAGGMMETEANISRNDHVLVTMGSREVEGLRSKGAGFLIEARAKFLVEGAEFDSMKQRFPWARAVVVIKPEEITQTL